MFQRQTLFRADAGSGSHVLLPLTALLWSIAVVFFCHYFPHSDQMTTTLLDSSTFSASISKFCCFNTAEWSAMSRTACRLMSFYILSLWEISESLIPTANRSMTISLWLALKLHFTASAWSPLRKLFPAWLHWRNLASENIWWSRFFRFP